MKKSEKQFFVENLIAELKSTKTFVLVDFVGLGVKLQQELKKRLKATNAKMLVVKNTLLKRAGKEAKINEDVINDTVLAGPTAIIISESDPIAPLQVLAKFTAEFASPQFKVGIIDGKFMDKENLIILSKLPSKETLAGQLIATISSPRYQLLNVLQGNLQKLFFVLNTKATESR